MIPHSFTAPVLLLTDQHQSAKALQLQRINASQHHSLTVSFPKASGSGACQRIGSETVRACGTPETPQFDQYIEIGKRDQHP